MTTSPSTGRPVLALDVDGTVSPFSPTGSWPDFAPTPRARLDTLLSAQMAVALAALPADRIWLTDWETSANAIIGATFGWAPLPVLTRPTQPDGGWWKLAALRAYRPRRGVPLVWVDDQLATNPEAQAWARRLPTPSLLISPDPFTGITPAHVEQISEFLTLHAPAA